MHDAFATKCARSVVSRRELASVALGCAAALAAFAAITPQTARACSCMTQAPREAIEQAAAVFEGYVESIETAEAAEGVPIEHRVRLRVVRTWKDAATEALVVTTAGDSAACGYPFEQGRSYLVYAFAQDGGLAVSLCGRTQPIERADEDLELLGMGATPVAPQGDTPLPPQARAESDDETREPPARGGCAGCSSVGGDGARAPLAPVLLLGSLALLTSRRRSRSRP